MSNFSIPFIKAADPELGVDGEPAHVEWREGGYLFIVSREHAGMLRANHEVQLAHGVKADLLDAAGLGARFPSMNVDDIECGVHTPEDGWCDPNGLLQAFRKKARSLGASYVYDRVVSIDGNGSTLALRLASGAVMHANHVVNAAGAWAKLISAMVGMP